MYNNNYKIIKKFRTGNAKLLIETGRWFNIPRENRICKLCACNKIGDEFHYLLKCTDVYIYLMQALYVYQNIL